MIYKHNKFLRTLIFVFCLFSVITLLSPEIVMADPPGEGAPGGAPGAGNNELIDNPLENINSIKELIVAILSIVIKIGVPIVAIALVYVGFLFVKAQGNETELKTAKDAFKYTIIGAGLVLGAVVISQAIQATVENLGATAHSTLALLVPTAYAADTVGTIITDVVVGGIINALMLLFLSLIMLYFLWGIVKFIRKSGDDKDRENAKWMMIYSIIGMTVVASLWGIVALITNTFFTTPPSTLPKPNIPSNLFGP